MVPNSRDDDGKNVSYIFSVDGSTRFMAGVTYYMICWSLLRSTSSMSFIVVHTLVIYYLGPGGCLHYRSPNLHACDHLSDFSTLRAISFLASLGSELFYPCKPHYHLPFCCYKDMVAPVVAPAVSPAHCTTSIPSSSECRSGIYIIFRGQPASILSSTSRGSSTLLYY